MKKLLTTFIVLWSFNCEAAIEGENGRLRSIIQKMWIECHFEYANYFFSVNVSPTEIAIGAASSCKELEDQYRDTAVNELADELVVKGLSRADIQRAIATSTEKLRDQIKAAIIDAVIQHRSKEVEEN